MFCCSAGTRSGRAGGRLICVHSTRAHHQLPHPPPWPACFLLQRKARTCVYTLRVPHDAAQAVTQEQLIRGADSKGVGIQVDHCSAGGDRGQAGRQGARAGRAQQQRRQQQQTVGKEAAAEAAALLPVPRWLGAAE